VKGAAYRITSSESVAGGEDRPFKSTYRIIVYQLEAISFEPQFLLPVFLEEVSLDERSVSSPNRRVSNYILFTILCLSCLAQIDSDLTVLQTVAIVTEARKQQHINPGSTTRNKDLLSLATFGSFCQGAAEQSSLLQERVFQTRIRKPSIPGQSVVRSFILPQTRPSFRVGFAGELGETLPRLSTSSI
jgi:hypothetical protein